MSDCGCSGKDVKVTAADPCCAAASQVPSDKPELAGPIGDITRWFDGMVGRCLQYAEKAKKDARPIVGIMCEYTPRELIIAAGGIPICMCGGSAETIPFAEEVLPSNLCPLIKSTFGYHLQQNNPFLEMSDLLVAETTCDGKKKMYELLSESRPMYILELPQKQDDGDAISHWRIELLKLKAKLEEQFEVEITDDRLRDAIRLMNRERSLKRKLAELMLADNPPMTGRQLLDCKSIISAIPEDLDQYEKTLKSLGDCSNSSKCSSSCCDEKPVRVLLTGVPIVHGAERIVDIIESCGGLVVCMENCTGLKPIIDDVDAEADSPIDAITDKYFRLPCSVQTVNRRRMELLTELAGQYRAQCIIDVSWQACLTYDVESALVKQLSLEKLHMPYLRISTDYSPSDTARITVRTEALFETVRGAMTSAG